MEIVVGGKYDYFDDGKIRESRRSECTIIEKIPFDKISDEILSLWKSEVKSCYWLYAEHTDFFLKSIINFPNESETVYFVRTKDGGWFSLGFWGGRLFEKSFWEKKKVEHVSD
jgi:hypothetical protein